MRRSRSNKGRSSRSYWLLVVEQELLEIGGARGRRNAVRCAASRRISRSRRKRCLSIRNSSSRRSCRMGRSCSRSRRCTSWSRSRRF